MQRNNFKKLKTGCAYHGNRILRHVEEDMRDIVRHNMNVVVHMFSHNDWDRHYGVMKNIFDISKENGLEVWVDNWGMGGAPGDKSHFLSYYPDAHQVFNTGEVNPVQVCFNHPAYVEFTKQWIDAVYDCGADKIFWDEPYLPLDESISGGKFTCCCNNCKKLFEEAYGKPMPVELTEEILEFRKQSLVKYFQKVTAYAAGKGMENIACVMVDTLQQTKDLLTLPHIDNFGVDPYWSYSNNYRNDVTGRVLKKNPYEYVYDWTKTTSNIILPTGKDYNIWIQAHGLPAGAEEEIFEAADGAYDAGARTILGWSYRGAESNTFKCECCEAAWHVLGEAMRRIKDRNLDELRNLRYQERISKNLLCEIE